MQFSILINNIEQLDLALNHLKIGNAGNARYALMLIDNALELTIHHAAKDKEAEIAWKDIAGEQYAYKDDLQKALGSYFEEKLKFSIILGIVDKQDKDAIIRFHNFRNELYHVGLQHEIILPDLAKFYFSLVTNILSKFNPQSLSFSGLGGRPVGNAANYFSVSTIGFFPKISEFREAAISLKRQSDFSAHKLSHILADNAERMIDESDVGIDQIAQKYNFTRDEAVSKLMAAKQAMSNDGRVFAEQKGFKYKNFWELIDWIEKNCDLPCRSDPIRAWRKRLNKIRSEIIPHKALEKYCSFVEQTSCLREIIENNQYDFEVYIEHNVTITRAERLL